MNLASFKFSAASAWKKLPREIRELKSLAQFKDSTIPSVASTSQEGQENRTLKVTLLSNEWKSSTDGELSTINRELAIQLAKHPNVDVSVLLPSCSREDRSSAKSHNVKLIEAQRVPGVEPVLWLSSPPRNHTMDCVIGHGVHLGRLITHPNYCHCKWIQVVHSAPEEDGMYRNISEGQKKQETEIQLCKMADQVVTIGPKLAEAYKRYLRPSKQGENVFDLTPSIFSEFLEKEQATEERQTFYVLVIGSGDSCEDFTVKGYDIAAKAIAELKDESYKLRFVCAPGGKGDQTAEKLLHYGVSRNQLLVHSFNDSREVLANLFCEADLAIMPSRTDGFGITALEALSAGLPILVSSNSGLGEALKKVSLGSQCVVDSEDPKDWAREIKRVRQKVREVRLSESRSLRKKYMKEYSWNEACRRLVNRMYELTFGLSESGTIFPISDKRPTPFVAADQPSKRLREELIHSTHHERQGSSSSSSPAPVAVDHTQGSLSEAFVNQNYHGSQNYPQSEYRKFLIIWCLNKLQ
ncbi:uncharacterized protein LOC111319069 [Stylophora pistillata]|uniref:uncharacterized protein LOC111319069 n=1 Tax=Stylophora pistillata TaxID=50429 RepID=UPI000C05256E|nr:uncharacterized protein LOC111319069 [Stylophora pistillata]